LDYLLVVNEYFIGISICKATIFIRFAVGINPLNFQMLVRPVKIPALITIYTIYTSVALFTAKPDQYTSGQDEKT